MSDPPVNPGNLPRNLLDRDRFVDMARDQIGDRYRFGAEADQHDDDPTAFDSSELVEWAAKRAGVTDMPDGSWNQYKHLHDRSAAVSVQEALQTKGALVFGFSSDPLTATDRPARAYVGISLGNGKVLDVSERSGEVREMDPGDFYNYGAVIPDFHGIDDAVPPPSHLPADDPYGDPLGIPGGVGTMPTPPPGAVDPAPVDPVDPGPGQPGVSYGPNGRILHQQFPGDENHPDGMPPEPEAPVCYPDEPAPEEQVCYPDDDGVDAVDAGSSTYSDSYGDL